MTNHIGGSIECHLLDLLSVPGCQTYEYKHTRTGDHPIKAGAFGEDVHNGCNDETYEGIEKEVAPFGEILGGELSIDAHCSECAGADEECLGNGCCRVEQEYGC